MKGATGTIGHILSTRWNQLPLLRRIPFREALGARGWQAHGPTTRSLLGNETVASLAAWLFVPSPPDSWPLPHKQIKPTRDHSGAGLPSPAENDHNTHFSLCIPWWPCQVATNRTCPGHSKSRHQAGSWLMDSWSLLPPAPPHPQLRLAQRKSGACPLDLDLEVEAPERRASAPPLSSGESSACKS